ncbi:MAG: SpoIIE family protein phosphatase [Phycisphaerae bacterium]|nr:SpoIIE family protein phosphatase [Phycisphaerae bacterium]
MGSFDENHGMRLIVTQSASMVADVTCEREAIYIGSRDDCRIQLSDQRIAEQQAVIFPEMDRSWAFSPLDTDNMVQINGQRISDKVTLKTGDEIRLFDFVIRVFPEQEAASVAASQPAKRTTSVARLTQFVQTHLPAGSLTKKLDEPLALQSGHLTGMSDITVRLCQTDSVEGVMDSALKALLETFAAHRAWIGVRRVNYGPMEYVEGRLLTGQTSELPGIGNDLKPRVLDRSQYVLIPRVSADEVISVMTGPLPGPDGLLGMLYLDSGESGRRFDNHDLDYFMLLANLIASQLYAILQQVAKNRGAMIAGEVSVAHAIQARITPRKLPQWDALNLGAFREPGTERTGDIYDILRLNNDMAAFMVAQTSATGAMPSMLMAQAQATFRASAMHLDAPHAFLRSLNWLLYDGQKDHPLDCFAGVIEPATGQVRYAIAGNPGAFIVGQRGDDRPLMTGEAPPPLGLDRNTAYPLLSERLEQGETLALFTQGIATAANRDGELFGIDRLVDILCDGFGQLASTMLKEMFNDMRAFTEGGAQPDDITVILAHRV